jgi:hypothetical protein
MEGVSLLEILILVSHIWKGILIWVSPNKSGHLNPDVESQHRYESKYFHEQNLNNSYFVLFL